jgi:hypothetical protein
LRFGEGPLAGVDRRQAGDDHRRRPDAHGGTTFTTASGQRMTFAPGQVWIVLAYR